VQSYGLLVLGHVPLERWCEVIFGTSHAPHPDMLALLRALASAYLERDVGSEERLVDVTNEITWRRAERER